MSEEEIKTEQPSETKIVEETMMTDEEIKEAARKLILSLPPNFESAIAVVNLAVATMLESTGFPLPMFVIGLATNIARAQGKCPCGRPHGHDDEEREAERKSKCN